jgi:parvulin-like peptidyl-prolyl isomerase
MRENTKVILWIVVVAFVVTIFAVWGLDLSGSGGPTAQQYNVVGKVNGIPITRNQYQTVYEQLAAQARAASPDQNLTYAQREMIQDQVWDNLISNILTDQEIEKLGISVTDQEIVAFLRTSPPTEIQQYFVDENGNFDFAAYQNALNNPDADWTSVEELARQRIPLLKLNRYLLSQVHVGPSEVRRAFEEENLLLTAEYVLFPIGDEDISEYTPSDEEIRGYYDTHPDEFLAGQRAVVEYVKIPIEPTDSDMSDIMYTVTNLGDQLADGEDFAVLAKTYSQAPTSSVGGETGFITAGQRNSNVMAQVAIMNPGQVSAPIQTDDGIYLVKLLETQTEGDETRYNFQEIFIELTAGPNTIDSLVGLAQDIQERAVENGLANAASEFGLALGTTEPFRRDFPIPGLGFASPVNRFTFNSEAGALSGVLADETAYYVCRVVERLADQLLPLDEVRTRIESTLKFERQKRVARRKAEAFHLKWTTTSDDFQNVATDYQYTVHNPEPFRVADPVDNLSPFSPFAYTALDLKDDAVSPPVECEGSYYVIHLIERGPFDEEAFQSRAAALNGRLQQQKAQTYMVYWFDQLKENAEIEDFRGRF